MLFNLDDTSVNGKAARFSRMHFVTPYQSSVFLFFMTT